MAGCKVIFWQDTTGFLNVRWDDATNAYEPVLHYQSKLSWNPLNGNPMSRDYHSEILLHKVDGEKIKTSSLAEFEGWTLEASLYKAGNKIFLIRGLNDSLATLKNRQILVLPDKKSNKSDWVTITEKRNILLAVPSPNAKSLAVITTSSTEEKKDGTIYFIVYDIQNAGPVRLFEQKIQWSGAPGSPLVAWSKDSTKTFLFRDKDVIAVDSYGANVVKQFPECFHATRFSGELSTSGLRLYRNRSDDSEDLPLVLTKGERLLSFDSIPIISEVSRIQAVCSQQ